MLSVENRPISKQSNKLTSQKANINYKQSKNRMNIQFLLSVVPEVLNPASSQDFKTSGFPLNPECFRDGNDGDVVTIMSPLISPDMEIIII